MGDRNQRVRTFRVLAIISAILTVGLPALWIVSVLLLEQFGGKDAGQLVGWVGIVAVFAITPFAGIATIVFTVLALTTRAGNDRRSGKGYGRWEG